LLGSPIWDNQQPSPSWEGSETIMGTSFLKKEDGIVHSIWKQIANIKEPRDTGATPVPATSIWHKLQKKFLRKNLDEKDIVLARLLRN